MAIEPTPPAASDGADPSMEEILASIRRILNDDDVPATTASAGETPAAEDDVLILDESMMVAATEPGAEVEEAAAAAAAEAEFGVADPNPVAAPPPVVVIPVVTSLDAPNLDAPNLDPPGLDAMAIPPMPLDPSALPGPTPGLVAPEAAAAAASSVDSLVRTLAAGRATRVYSGGPTLEDMVRAELRPLLKAWLDTNLPPLVERLVRTEIERVVGRGVS